MKTNNASDQKSLRRELDSKTKELNDIYSSRGWRFVLYVRKVLNFLFPREGIRRKTLAFSYGVSKKSVKQCLKIKDEAYSIPLRFKNYFIKLKPKKKRRVNRNSKKIVFIGHSYHTKTKSADFLVDYLKEFYDVQVILDESWIGKSFPDLSFIDESYLGVIFFQMLPQKSVMDKIKNDNLLHFPMYDHSCRFSLRFWDGYRNLKIINFSKTMHDQLNSWGFESIYLQYFPKPCDFTPGKNDEVFFWQRLSNINIKNISKLFGTGNYKIHLHRAIDPGNGFVQPSRILEKRFNITYSDWFEDKSEILDLIKQKGIYVAPREFEGIGMSFLEAMAMGKAVVAVDNPTMNEYIIDKDNGYLFDPRNPKVIDLTNINEVQRNSFEFIRKGYEEWSAGKHKIIDFIMK
jgi:glycosyltransferase involved in cell wall biosynthesis